MSGHALVTVEGGSTSSLIRKLTNFLDHTQGRQSEMIGKIQSATHQLEKIEDLLLNCPEEKAEDDPVKSIMQKKNLDRRKVMMRLRELSFGMEDNVDKLILWTGRRASKGINEHESNIQRSCDDIKALHDILTGNMRGVFREEGWMFHQLVGSELHQSSRSTASDLHQDDGVSSAPLSANGITASDPPSFPTEAHRLMNEAHQLMKQELVELLLKGWDAPEQQLKVISVVGIGGFSKTRIAKEVYDEEKIEQQFKCKYFESMTKLPEMRAIFQGIKKLPHEILIDKRYFIIIYGIWRASYWRIIKEAFPQNNEGTRIMISTCMKSIAKACCIHGGDILYEMEPFIFTNSRKLFRQSLSGPDNAHISDGISEISNYVAEISTAPLLAKEDATVEGGSVSRRFVPSSIPELENGINDLPGSYYDLPSNMEGVDVKACALYFSILPSNHTIDRDWLVRIWISEGLVPAEGAAKGYLDKLVSQNIIQPVECCNSIEVKTYQVRCMMLLKSVSEMNNFVTLLCPSNSNNSSGQNDKYVCRLSVHGSESTVLNSIKKLKGVEQKSTHIRSLTVFGGDIKQISFEDFVNLRVLELDGCEGMVTDKMKYICKMQLLKYLGLKNTQLSELPPQIKDLAQLETLDIRNTQVRKLPKDVNQLEKLLHLLIGNSHAHFGLKLPVGISKKLQLLKVLCSIDLREYQPEVLQELANLKKLEELEIVLPYDEHADVKRNDDLLSSLEKCKQLQSLVIHGDFICSMDDRASYRTKGRATYIRHLKKLRLTTIMFKDVSMWIKTQINLDLLDIRVSTFDDNDLMILQKLTKLQSLALRLEALPRKEVGNGEEEPVCIRIKEGFSSLKKFSFDCLMPWICFEENSMPMLEHLEFKFTGGPLPSKDTSRSGGQASENLEFGIEHLTSLGKVVLWCSRHNTNVEETIKLMGREANRHKNVVIFDTNCYPSEMQMPQPQINADHVESSSVAVGHSVIGTAKDIVPQISDQGCNAVVPCDICEQVDHTALKCPLLMSPKPAVKMYGHGVKGLGFHQIHGSENRLGVVHVSQGSSAADLEKELQRLVLIKWQWKVKNNEKMKNSFIVNFPSRAELLKLTKNSKFAINATSVVQKVVEWFPSTSKRQLVTLWVKVGGVPSDARDYLSLWEVGSLVGSTVDVDMRSAESQETIRIQVAVLKPDLFPCSMEVAVGTWLYTFYFEIEQRDENNKGINMDNKGANYPEQDPYQAGSENKVNSDVLDYIEGRPEVTTSEIMEDKRQAEDQKSEGIDSDDNGTHYSDENQPENASAENSKKGGSNQDSSEEIGESSSSKQADKIISKPRGLKNLGNTCYFNAVLQSLLALESFRAEMLDLVDPTGDLVKRLKGLFMDTRPLKDTKDVLIPQALFESCSKYTKIELNRMEDSHEVLVGIRDGLSKELQPRNEKDLDTKKTEVPTFVDSIFGGELCCLVSSQKCTHFSEQVERFQDLSLAMPSRSTDIDPTLTQCMALFIKPAEKSYAWECEECYKEVEPTNPNEGIEGVETVASTDYRKNHGELLPTGRQDGQKLTAGCGQKEIIDRIMKATDFSQVLNSYAHCIKQVCVSPPSAGAQNTPAPNFSATGNKQDEEKKKESTIKRDAMRRHLIGKLPPVLTIHLKRFDVSQAKAVKICGHVDFEEILDVRPFMDPRAFPCGDVNCRFKMNDNTTYRLVAVIEHKGDNCNVGHYVAYVRCGESWYWASDKDVKPASLKMQVLTCEVYILFYEKCKANAMGLETKTTTNKKDILQGKGNIAFSEQNSGGDDEELNGPAEFASREDVKLFDNEEQNDDIEEIPETQLTNMPTDKVDEHNKKVDQEAA